MTGRALVEHLDADGYAVVGADVVSPDRAREVLPAEIAYECCDISSKDKVAALWAKHPTIDAVMHVAAIVPYNLSWSGLNSRLWEVNVVGTSNLVDVGRDNGVKHFVLASSSGVAFKGTTDLEAAEEAPASSEPLNDAYSDTKAAAELVVMGASDASCMAAVALRPNGIWGPGGETHHTPKVLATAQLGLSGMAMGVRGITDFTHVDNLCHAFLLSLHALEGRLSSTTREEVAGQAMAITDGLFVPTLAMFAPLLGELGFARPFPYKVVDSRTGEPLEAFFDTRRDLTDEEEEHAELQMGEAYVPAPHAVVTVSAWLMEAVCALLGTLSLGFCRLEPFLTSADSRKLWFHNSYSTAKAKRLLGWRPMVSPAVGVRETIAYYRALGYSGRLPWPDTVPAVSVLLGLGVLAALALNLWGALDTATAGLAWAAGAQSAVSVELPLVGLQCTWRLQRSLQALLGAAVATHAIEAVFAVVAAWELGLMAPGWFGLVLLFGFPAVVRMLRLVSRPVPVWAMAGAAVAFFSTLTIGMGFAAEDCRL
jgi:3beta-hydroxy-delta5-steroid dehydrogenase/steroid delta-isomerase